MAVVAIAWKVLPWIGKRIDAWFEDERATRKAMRDEQVAMRRALEKAARLLEERRDNGEGN